MIFNNTHIQSIAFIVFLGLITGSVFSPAFADQVEFGEGNVLQGTVTSFQDETLVFSTKYAETIKIPSNLIKTLTTDERVHLKLTNDSVLSGKLTTLEDGRLAIILEPMGEAVPIKWEQIKFINEPPGGWEGHIALGGNTKTGNTVSTNINLNFGAKREWESDRFQFRFFYNYEEEDGNVNGRDAYGTSKFDHFFSEDFFLALSMEFLTDEFKDLNLRFISGLGLGYRLWNTEIVVFELEAGVAYFVENLDLGQDDEFMSGRVGLTLSLQILENLLFTNYALYYPSLEEPKEYKLRNEASLISTLGKGWSLKVTHIFEQDSLVENNIEKTDNQIIFAIQYVF